MGNLSISKKLKIGVGLTVFGSGLLVIVLAFLISVGLFFKILFVATSSIILWIGPLLFLGLTFFTMAWFGRKYFKVFFLCATFLAGIFGILDVTKIVWPAFDLTDPLQSLRREGNNSVLKQDGSIIINSNDIATFYENEESYFATSEVLGYVPARNSKTKTYSTYKNEKLFDVTYTIDKNNQRISPPFLAHKDARSILFFGCSLNFGYGLEDNQTTPYIVGDKTKGKYKIYNFSFNGFGPHQMASAFEHNLVDSIVTVKPKHIFYTATHDHLDRIRNRKNWGGHDPKYELGAQGEAVYKGHFDESKTDLLNSVVFDWKQYYTELRFRSYTLQQIQPIENQYEREYAQEDQELFVALVRKARDLAKKKYPDAEFHVIYWIMNERTEGKIINELARNNIETHLITDIIPDYGENLEKYWLRYPIEPHPNVLANTKISDYMIEKILKNELIPTIR